MFHADGAGVPFDAEWYTISRTNISFLIHYRNPRSGRQSRTILTKRSEEISDNTCEHIMI